MNLEICFRIMLSECDKYNTKSINHDMSLQKLHKNSLSAFDEKRYSVFFDLYNCMKICTPSGTLFCKNGRLKKYLHRYLVPIFCHLSCVLPLIYTSDFFYVKTIFHNETIL